MTASLDSLLACLAGWPAEWTVSDDVAYFPIKLLLVSWLAGGGSAASQDGCLEETNAADAHCC